MLGRINHLTPLVANQIAAGEMVSRPVSVVKELIENSLDAGASMIEVRIADGGGKLIQVRDNGCGIHQDDMALAISRHATSKISTTTDLEHINTFGFRGEALASICSVAQVELTSAQQGAKAWQVAVAGFNAQPVLQPVAHPQGTTVAVHNLFFNVPARRKFLRSSKTEFAHIDLLIKRLALITPTVAYKLWHNEKLLRHYRALDDDRDAALDERLAALFPPEFISQHLDVQHTNNDMTVRAWLAYPSIARSNADLQYLYVNQRVVKDRVLAHAVRTAYHDVLYGERNPLYALCITVPADIVDVNVHPTKDEVRFKESRAVYDLVYFTVSNALAQIGQQSVPQQSRAQEEYLKHAAPPDKRAYADDAPNDRARHETKDHHDALGHSRSPQPVTSVPHKLAELQAAYQTLYAPNEPQPRHPESSASTAPLKTTAPTTEPVSFTQQTFVAAVGAAQHLGQAIGQLHNTYILAEHNDGLIIVDMHAAHERILYERLKAEMASKQARAQVLLTPIIVDLPGDAAAYSDELLACLTSWGFQGEDFGNNTIVIRAIPVVLADTDIAALCAAVVHDLVNAGCSMAGEQARNKLLATLACRAAVHAKRHLTIVEMNELLRAMEATPRNQQCNHGRPAWVCLSPQALDKMFLRGQ